jgi:hypothetical protein
MIEQVRDGETLARRVAKLPGDTRDVIESNRTRADAAAGSTSATVARAVRNASLARMHSHNDTRRGGSSIGRMAHLWGTFGAVV